MNSYTTKLTYRDASLDGMYPTPSYMDDISAVFVKDQTWPQAESSWLQVGTYLCKRLYTNVEQLNTEVRNLPIFNTVYYNADTMVYVAN